jgi:hypothetical protein
MKTIDLHLTQDQVASLAVFAPATNPLSPFNAFKTSGTVGRFTNPEIVNPDGSFTTDFQEMLSTLQNPGRTANLTLIKNGELIDTAWYFPKDAVGNQVISLSKDMDELRFQAPAQIDEFLRIIRVMLGPTPAEFNSFEGNLDLTAAWLFWCILDLIHAGEQKIMLDSLQKSLKEQFDGLNSFSGYFRETLGLALPSKSEVEKAVFRLVQFGVLEPSEGGFSPNIEMQELGRNFDQVIGHLHFKLNTLNPENEVETIRLWAVQGRDGTCLLWFESTGNITYRTVTPGVLMTVVREFLVMPAQKVVPPPAPAINPGRTVKVEKYQPPVKRKSVAGTVIISLLAGIGSLLVSLVLAGFITFLPGRGVAFNPSGATVTPPIATIIVAGSTTEVPAVSNSMEPVQVSPNDLQVDMVTALRVSDSQTMVMGRIRNIGETSVYSPTIELELKDESGNLIQTGSAYPYSQEIAPNEESYFSYYYDLGQPISFVTTTIHEVYPGDNTNSQTMASIEQTSLYATTYGVYLIGEVVNHTDKPIALSSIYGVVFDQDNQLLGVSSDSSYLMQLRPGENVPVKVYFELPPEVVPTVSNFQLFAECYPVDTVVDSPISVSKQQTIFRFDGRLKIASEVMNTADKPVQFTGLVAAFYDADGKLLDVSFSGVNIPLLPGGTAPILLYGWDFLDQEQNQQITPASYLLLATESSSYGFEKTVLIPEVIIEKREKGGMWYEITGTITNNNPETIYYGAVLLALRDPITQTIVSEEPIYISELANGGVQHFNVLMVVPADVDQDQMVLEYVAGGSPGN